MAGRINLLVLKGVHLSSFTDIGEQLSKPIQGKGIVEVSHYTSIPKKFTTVAEWPQTCNWKCRSCARVCTGYPRFIPTNVETDADGNDTCDPIVAFDEWACAARYINIAFPELQQPDLNDLLCIFEAKFSGRRKEKIMPAPDPACMKDFSGDEGITSAEYTEKIRALERDYSLSSYSIHSYQQKSMK